MTIDFDCSSCGHVIRAPERFAGRRTKCPKCKEPIAVPDPASEDPVGEAPVGEAPDTDRAEVAATKPRRRRPPAKERRRVTADGVPSKSGSIAMAAAIGGAVVGALIWSAIAYFTEREIGWIAWLVGGLIGGACVAVGGRGQKMAVTCGVLAVVSIATGKFVGTHFAVGKYLHDQVASAMTEEDFEELRFDWTEFAKLPDPASDEQLRTFMIDHDFEGSTEEFRKETAPQLREFARREPTLEEWRDSTLTSAREEVALTEIVTANLNAIDIVFVILGISTAFGLVMKASASDAAEARSLAREERRSQAS